MQDTQQSEGKQINYLCALYAHAVRTSCARTAHELRNWCAPKWTFAERYAIVRDDEVLSVEEISKEKIKTIK